MPQQRNQKAWWCKEVENMPSKCRQLAGSNNAFSVLHGADRCVLLSWLPSLMTLHWVCWNFPPPRVTKEIHEATLLFIQSHILSPFWFNLWMSVRAGQNKPNKPVAMIIIVCTCCLGTKASALVVPSGFSGVFIRKWHHQGLLLLHPKSQEGLFMHKYSSESD